MEEGTTALVAEPGRPETPPAGEPEGGLNVPLLLGFIVVLALVSVQNLWLRRRAERDRDDTPPRPDA